MKLLYDLKLKNGEIINECYFVGNKIPVYSGRKALITYWTDSIDCLSKSGKEIEGKNFINAEIIKIFDEDTNTDVTDMLGSVISQFPEDYLTMTAMIREYRLLTN